MINILILSAGTRDKVVQYFKEALAGKGKVIATDCSPYAPAIYEADEYVLVPRITEPGYLDKILEICREKSKIKGNKCYLCLHFVKLERIYDFY